MHAELAQALLAVDGRSLEVGGSWEKCRYAYVDLLVVCRMSLFSARGAILPPLRLLDRASRLSVITGR